MSLQGEVTNEIREILELDYGEERLKRIAGVLNQMTTLGQATIEMDNGRVPPEIYMAGFNAIVCLYLAEVKDEITVENRLSYIQSVVQMTTQVISMQREGSDGTETEQSE